MIRATAANVVDTERNVPHNKAPLRKHTNHPSPRRPLELGGAADHSKDKGVDGNKKLEKHSETPIGTLFERPASRALPMPYFSVSESPAVKDLLQVLLRLLGLHEVRLAVQLLKELSQDSLGDKTLAISKDDFSKSLRRIVLEMQKEIHNGQAGIHELEKIVGLSSPKESATRREVKEKVIETTIREVKDNVIEIRSDALRYSRHSRSEGSRVSDVETLVLPDMDLDDGKTRSSRNGLLPGSIVEPISKSVAFEELHSEDLGEKSTSSFKYLTGDDAAATRARKLYADMQATGELLKMASFDGYESFQFDEDTSVQEPSHKFILHPNGNIRMTWDALALLAIIYESVTVPLTICWELSLDEVMMWLLTGFFAADIFLNFVTGFFHDGALVMKQREIATHYARGWLIIDIVSTFPWGAVFDSSSSDSSSVLRFAKVGKLMRVLRLLRLAKLNVLIKRVEELFASSAVIIFFSLLKMIFSFLLACHWCACTWGWLGEPGRYKNRYESTFRNESGPIELATCEPGGPCEPSIQGSPWRRRYAVELESVSAQYLFAMRFATGLFTGGDMGLQPGYWTERVFVVTMMFVGFLLCSTVLSQVVLIFHKINEEGAAQADKMQSFKQFLAAAKIPIQLQQKVKRYLEFQYKSRKALQLRRFDLMEQLSPFLKHELMVHLNRRVLVQHAFFREMAEEILAHTCCLCNNEWCAPGDVVVHQGQFAEKMYFIVQGKVQVVYTETPAQRAGNMLYSRTNSSSLFSSTSPKIGGVDLSRWQPADRRVTARGYCDFSITAPGYVGASGLFAEVIRSYTVISANFSELLTVSRYDIHEELLKEFPRLAGHLENYMKVAEERGHVPAEKDCSLWDEAEAQASERRTYVSEGQGLAGTIAGKVRKTIMGSSMIVKDSSGHGSR